MKDIDRMVREAREQVVNTVPPQTFDLDLFHKHFAVLVRSQALEDAAKYLENVHPTRLVKFANAIRAIKV